MLKSYCYVTSKIPNEFALRQNKQFIYPKLFTILKIYEQIYNI
jgi:hypothetical protein